MVQLWNGTIDDYFKHCAIENQAARNEQALIRQSETDPALQCEHGRSLYGSCRDCVEPV